MLPNTSLSVPCTVRGESVCQGVLVDLAACGRQSQSRPMLGWLLWREVQP